MTGSPRVPTDHQPQESLDDVGCKFYVEVEPLGSAWVDWVLHSDQFLYILLHDVSDAVGTLLVLAHGMFQSPQPQDQFEVRVCLRSASLSARR